MKSLVTTIKPLVNYIIRNGTIVNFTAFSQAYCLNIIPPCYKVDDGNRLATSCSNKNQLADNFCRAGKIRLVGTIMAKLPGAIIKCLLMAAWVNNTELIELSSIKLLES